jgi:hypothetical protein
MPARCRLASEDPWSCSRDGRRSFAAPIAGWCPRSSAISEQPCRGELVHQRVGSARHLLPRRDRRGNGRVAHAEECDPERLLVRAKRGGQSMGVREHSFDRTCRCNMSSCLRLTPRATTSSHGARRRSAPRGASRARFGGSSDMQFPPQDILDTCVACSCRASVRSRRRTRGRGVNRVPELYSSCRSTAVRVRAA